MSQQYQHVQGSMEPLIHFIKQTMLQQMHHFTVAPKPHKTVCSARGRKLRPPFSTPSSGQGRFLLLRRDGFARLKGLWGWGMVRVF
jgi:hypothetical protein